MSEEVRVFMRWLREQWGLCNANKTEKVRLTQNTEVHWLSL